MSSRAYVLVSGGIDSTTCLYMAASNHGPENVMGVSMAYGQRHSKELRFAQRACAWLAIEYNVLDLSGIIPQTLLTSKDPIPNVSYAEITGVSPAYVPFRNGLMLSALASYVAGERDQSEDTDEWFIYFGAHAEDAQNWAYADCSAEFTGAMANAIRVGTYDRVRLRVPLQWMVKHEIITLGTRLGVNFKNTWSCYAGGEKHCGQCPTCRSRKEGFIRADVPDPTEYEQ